MACGSGGSKDLIDENAFTNALIDLQTIENASNSDDLETESRLSGSVRTLQGRLQQIAGYIAINEGAWADSISVDGYEEYMIFNNTAYKVKAGVALPLISTATPDLNDFEPFSITTTKEEVFIAVDEYNTTELGNFTDYVFSSTSNMVAGIVLGGDTVTFKVDQALKVNGELNEVACYIVNDSQIGLALNNGLYASEIYAKVSDSSGSSNNPIASLDPANDARNFPKPGLSLISVSEANLDHGFGGGVLSQQNKIYAMPNQKGTVFKYDVSDKSSSTIGSITAGQGYTSGALANNGMIYSASTSGDKILEIDTVNDTLLEYSGLNVANIGFDGAVSADTGLLYFIPSSSTQVVEFNPVTKGVAYIGSTYSITANKWAGGCLAGNGKIYCAPHENGNILEIDPVSKLTRLIATSTTATFARWKGCVLGSDDKVYFVPYNATEVMVYDHLTDSVSYMATGLSANADKWVGGNLGFNGKIYCMPNTSDTVLEIDVVAQTVSEYAFPTITGTNKAHGAVSDVDGVMYAMPSNADSNMLVIDGIEGSTQWQVSAYSNKY